MLRSHQRLFAALPVPRTIAPENPTWVFDKFEAMKRPRKLEEGPRVHIFTEDQLPNYRSVVPTRLSLRVGVPAFKLGTMPLWDPWGVQRLVTVCQMDRIFVAQERSVAEHGFTGMVLSIGSADTPVPDLHLNYFLENGIDPAFALMEFDCSGDCLLPLRTQLTARHYTPGQAVWVASTSAQKPFQDVVKRHGFKKSKPQMGGRTILYNKRSSGSIGTIGAGVVWAGKKMGGHTGNNKIMVASSVLRIDANHNLLYLEGQVPGGVGTVLRVLDRRTRRRNKNLYIPHPTFVPLPDKEYHCVVDAPPLERDPFLYHDKTIFEGKTR